VAASDIGGGGRSVDSLERNAAAMLGVVGDRWAKNVSAEARTMGAQAERSLAPGPD